MVNYKEVVKKIGIVGITDLFIRLKAFILIPIITKTLGAGPYGVWTQVMVTVNMLLPIAMLGMQYGFLRYLPGETDRQVKEDASSIIVLVSITSLIGALLMFSISGFISTKFLGSKDFSALVKLGGIYLLTISLRDLLLNYFKARERIFFYSSLVFIDAILSIALSLIIVCLGYGVNMILWGFIILNIAIVGMSLLRIYKENGLSFPSFVNTKKYLRYSLPFLPLIWLLWINNSSDRYFIGYFMDVRDVGIYSVCYSISYFVINIISGPIHLVFLPIITRLWNNSNRELSARLINNLIKYTLFFTIPNAVFFFVVSKSIISIFASPDFVSGNITIPFILLAYTCYVTANCIEPIVYLLNKSSSLIWVYLVCASINIILNLILIPRIGILGAAISTMCSFTIQLLITYSMVLKEKILNVDFIFLAKNIISALTASFIISYIPQTKFLYSLFIIIIGIVLYISITILLKTFKKADLEIVKAALTNMRYVSFLNP